MFYVTGESFYYHSGQQFTTRDRDNDNYSTNCVNLNDVGGGWWYNNCFNVCLTCTGGAQYRWLGHLGNGPLKASYIMVRRRRQWTRVTAVCLNKYIHCVYVCVDMFIGVKRHMQRYFSYLCDGTDVQADWRRRCTLYVLCSSVMTKNPTHFFLYYTQRL